MEFEPPDPADLANVYSLNRAFLELVIGGAAARRLLRALPPEASERLPLLGPLARERLAGAPFLLFSLGDDEHERWQAVFDGNRCDDLFSDLERAPDAEAGLVSAALGFLWQLAKRRPYVTRVISGADAEWCQRLAECTLLDLMRHAAASRGLLRFQLAGDRSFWRRLMAAGTSDDRATRDTARLSALQTLLTRRAQPVRQRLAAAACAMPAPAIRGPAASTMSNPGGRGYNTPPDESPEDRKTDQGLRER